MMKKSRLLFYLFINIVISAATTLTVLWIWDRISTKSQASPISPVTLTAIDNANESSNPSPVDPSESTMSTLDFFSGEIQASIHAIVGPGNIDVEYVEIRNQSPGTIDMTGWQLVDQDGNKFTFPALILNEDGAIKILSKTGNNTVIELYWQSETAIWQSGETARLLNTESETIATYSIP